MKMHCDECRQAKRAKRRAHKHSAKKVSQQQLLQFKCRLKVLHHLPRSANYSIWSSCSNYSSCICKGSISREPKANPICICCTTSLRRLCPCSASYSIWISSCSCASCIACSCSCSRLRFILLHPSTPARSCNAEHHGCVARFYSAACCVQCAIAAKSWRHLKRLIECWGLCSSNHSQQNSLF